MVQKNPTAQLPSCERNATAMTSAQGHSGRVCPCTPWNRPATPSALSTLLAWCEGSHHRHGGSWAWHVRTWSAWTIEILGFESTAHDRSCHLNGQLRPPTYPTSTNPTSNPCRAVRQCVRLVVQLFHEPGRNGAQVLWLLDLRTAMAMARPSLTIASISRNLSTSIPILTYHNDFQKLLVKKGESHKGLLASLASCVNKESLLFQAECWYSFQIPRVILPNTMRIPSSSCWVFQPWRPSFFWHVQQPLKHIKSIHAPLRSSARCGSTRPNTWRPRQPGSPVMAAVWYCSWFPAVFLWDLFGTSRIWAFMISNVQMDSTAWNRESLLKLSDFFSFEIKWSFHSGANQHQKTPKS